MGIFHVTIGTVLLVGGIIGFVYTSKSVELYESGLGILGRAFSPELEEKYQTAVIIQLASIALGIIGIISLIYGFVRK